MDVPWPWLAVAAAGALHGLNPATGWALAAWRTRGARRATARAVVPIAAGHLASVAVVAAAVPASLQLGVNFDPLVLQGLAAAGLLLVARHVRGHPRSLWSPTGGGALALWSFISTTAHGAGWMLVPALVPLCASQGPARELTASGSALLALAALGIHLAAMLAATAVVATGAARLLHAIGRRRGPPAARLVRPLPLPTTSPDTKESCP